MKANEQGFHDAFVAEMQKEFDEGSSSEADSVPEEDSIPLQLLDDILKEDDETDSKTTTPEDINLDDLNIDALLEGNEYVLTQQAQDQHEVQHQVYQAEVPASDSLDVPEGTVLGHRNSDAEDYAMLAGAMSTIEENDSADAAKTVSDEVPPKNGASQQQKSECNQPRQQQSTEIESFAEGDSTAEDVAASPWIMVNDEQYGSYFWNQETQDSAYEFPKEGYYTPDGSFVTPQQSMAFAAEQAAANEGYYELQLRIHQIKPHEGNNVEMNEVQQVQNVPSDANSETSLQQYSLEKPAQNAQPQQNSPTPIYCSKP